MHLSGIAALSLLSAAVLGAVSQWNLGICLIGCLLTFGAAFLAEFALISGTLFRALASAAVLTGAVAAAVTSSLFTFVWAFFLVDFVLILLALAFLVWVCGRVDLEKPQETDDPAYRRIMYVYIEALMNLVLVRLHTNGLEKTPKEGRFLLVCNHLFLADPGILLHCFKNSQLTFITKQENWTMPIINKFMHKIRCQGIDREDDRQALKAILKCIQFIKNDEVSVAVFPEGYTSKDGKLHHFRPGAFKIAQKTGVPIVVCTIRNTRQIFKNLAKLRRTDVELHLVDVIQPESIKGKSTVEVSNQVYEMMIADLGEEYRAE